MITTRSYGILRIIAGKHRGRTLLAPKGVDTRPTLDRVRESLFNILQGRMAEARVLDLFAGSGALGLESLSRGAQQAVFVDVARQAQEVVRRNVQALREEEHAVLLPVSWQQALRTLKAQAAAFDLIFLDPPYHMPDAQQMLDALSQSGLLAQEGMVVYEHAKDHPPSFERWTVADARHYGDTQITFLTQAGERKEIDADGVIPGQL